MRDMQENIVRRRVFLKRWKKRVIAPVAKKRGAIKVEDIQDGP